MTPGWKSTEYWLSLKWCLMAACSTGALFHSPWEVALCAMPAVCVLIYMAAAICNNYGENRYLLKLGRTPQDGEEAPKHQFGFRFVAPEPNEEEGDEE